MEQTCSDYYSVFCSICPNLRPFLSPRLPPTFHQAIFKATSDSSLEKSKQRSCEYCSAKTDCQLQTEWTPNFFTQSFKLSDIKFCCQKCASLRDLDYFLELSLCSPGDQDGQKLSELRTLILHFAKINNRIPSSRKNSEENEIHFSQLSSYVQQVYSLAFTLKIALSNIPGLRVLDHEGNYMGNVTNESYCANVIQSMLLAKKASIDQGVNNKKNDNNEVQETQKGKKRDRTELEENPQKIQKAKETPKEIQKGGKGNQKQKKKEQLQEEETENVNEESENILTDATNSVNDDTSSSVNDDTSSSVNGDTFSSANDDPQENDQDITTTTTTTTPTNTTKKQRRRKKKHNKSEK